MKLEFGKMYLTRDGKQAKVKDYRIDEDKGWYHISSCDNSYIVDSEGFAKVTKIPTQYDLVAEYEEAN